MIGAVAVDLGASSGRFAAGKLENGRITYEVIAQKPYAPVEKDGSIYWDLDPLISLCASAKEYANAFYDSATVGIDTWGVDHGFLDKGGWLLQMPFCYRDLSHVEAFEALAEHRPNLYALTGCQHQPFNTLCQLAARRVEDPSIVERPWLILPDLLGHQLVQGIGARSEMFYEQTQASTTQLMGLDGKWCQEAFDLIAWPVPRIQPSSPGGIGPRIDLKVRLAHVGSHDTASAVCGFGGLGEDQAFLNVGTWSLFGCVLPAPLATPEAEAAAFTNEWTVDGKVRFLKNIPGFYVVNRIHEELGTRESVADWLANAEPFDGRADLLDPSLYNPDSMSKAVARLAGKTPDSVAQWASLALESLTDAIALQPRQLESLTGKNLESIRIAGGGSQSRALCQLLADKCGLPVISGPVEATVLGNLAMQFLASGVLADHAEMRRVIDASYETREFLPR